jgi:serine protease
MSTRHGAKLLQSFSHVLRGFVVQADPRALEKLLADDRVKYVEENAIGGTTEIWYNPPSWGLDRVDQRPQPLNNAYIYDTTAWNVHAYVVDTGIQPHNDWVGRQGNGMSTISDGRGASDCNGHGTHVAGTIGSTNYGVAKSVTMYPVRVAGCDGIVPAANVIAGLDWIQKNRKNPAVANISLGFPGGVNSLDAAIDKLITSGVTVVVGAGNGGLNACNYSPSRVQSAITVGATDSSDKRSWWTPTQSSNWGSCLDLFAPGTNIKSTWIGASNSATNTISGTSMAAPHVAGAAAIYLSGKPNATPAEVASAIISASTKDVVSDPVGSPNRLLYSRFTPPNCGLASGNFTLFAQQSLKSCDGRLALVMQSDGNLVLYKGGTPLWASQTQGSNHRAVMQSDGNLVVYNGNNAPVWASNSGGYPGAVLNVQNDGNAVIYHNGSARWHTNTCCQ